ncbi:MAG: peptidylprolyl isomerase [Flavisolibacter sp.]|jgi:peptidyl-prolyl cis-trans isomerase B (cyclophilin B)|nr:peptidylprolyl isomerase [Flavisolibacter sp.]
MKVILQLLLLSVLMLFNGCVGQKDRVTQNDRSRDVEMQTTAGTMVLRLSDATPMHRDNFLKLVKSKYYDSILFHRVIKNFMIQAGDDQSRRAQSGQPLGNSSVPYLIDAEFQPQLFHKKGALAAARTGDDVNPEKKSSGSQFYIVQGRVFTDAGLDSVETNRLKGRKIPVAHREVYKNIGGSPHLDQNYTVFGELVKGFDVLDSIAATTTSKAIDRDRPLNDVRIIKARLIRRKNY